MRVLYRSCALIFLFLMQACASLFYSTLPNFKPSKPVEEASSFSEAIGICSEYQIEEKHNKTAAIVLENSFSIVPWMRCIEFPIRNFSDAEHHEDLVALYREFGRLHSQDSKHEKLIIHPSEMNLAVRALFQHMQNNDVQILTENKNIISAALPEFAFYLNESGRFLAKEHTSQIPPKKMKKFSLAEKAHCEIIKLKKYRDRVFEKNKESIELKKLDEHIQILSDNFTKNKFKISTSFDDRLCFDAGYFLVRPDPVQSESGSR